MTTTHPILRQTVSEPALTALAARLAGVLVAGDCVSLRGDLGAGKTTFARALIRAYSMDPTLDVPSPTFALRQDYASARGAIVHFDLYRIADPRELDEIGFDDALANAVTIVEWPERAGASLPASQINITLAHTAGPDLRRITIAGDEAFRDRLARITEPSSDQQK